VDVLLTPAARLEIKALEALRLEPSAWAALLGHKRGFRFVIERVFAAGTERRLPDERTLARLEGIWPGRVVGLLVVRPGRAIKRAVLGPAWFGKLVLVSSGPVKAPVLSPHTVDFNRRFFLDPVPFAPPAKEDRLE
jgi:hypothetical protein